MCAPRLELRWEARLVEVDAVAAHWDPFCEQQLSLWLSLGNRSVGAYDAVPGKIVIGREDMPDETGRPRVDVAVGPDVALRDRADTLDHALGPRGPVYGVWAAATTHRQAAQGVSRISVRVVVASAIRRVAVA